MAPRCMHSAALVASLTAVSMRIATSGSPSRAAGTRSTSLVPGRRMSQSMSAMRWRLSCSSASSPVRAAYTSNCCCCRNFLRAFRMGSSSSTTRIWTGPAMSATLVLLMGGWWILHQLPQPSLTFYEADLHRPREQARPMRPRQQLDHGPPAGLSIIHGVVIHVHADEAIGAGGVQPATLPLRVRQGLRPVGEPVLNARLQVSCDVAHQVRPEVAPHHVAAERQRQPCLRAPPLAEVDPEMQTAVGVGELALVNQQSRVRPAGRHVVFDLIEWP